MNFRFPVFLDVTGKRCLVIGAGYEVAGKVKSLIDAGAETLYINPTAAPEIEHWAAMDLVVWKPRAFEPTDLDGCLLVITDHPDNSEIFRLAEERGILCNSVDDPEHCRFSFGSVHRQGDLNIAISTNGWAPALAVRLRQQLEREIGPEYGALLALLKEARPTITARISDFARRRDLWYRIVDSSVLAKLREGREQAAADQVRQLIEEAIHASTSTDPAN
ncbi:MAG: bifunctional precorrin-2 dehydrogenase/sirohydrochlorin ferrochelatase [Bryobacteraceae bacterium]